MSTNPCTKWYWNDWDNDHGLALCSLAAQGLWMRMLSIAARAGGYVRIDGKACSVEDIAILVGRSVGEVAPLIDELGARSVFSRTRDGTCYNRRMIKFEKRRKKAVIAGRNGGNPALRSSHSNSTEKSPNLKGEDKGGDKDDPPPTLAPLTSLKSLIPSEAEASVGRARVRPPPKPTERSNGSNGRKSQITDDWQPDLEDRQYAAGRGWDGRRIAEQAEAFRDHHLTEASLKANWHAAWRTWVRRSDEYAERDRHRVNGSAGHSAPRSGSFATAARSVMSRIDSGSE